MIQKIDELIEPPVVGNYYLVPHIRDTYSTLSDKVKKIELPVYNNFHSDADFFAVQDNHYHYDLRFVSRRELWLINWFSGRMATKQEESLLNAQFCLNINKSKENLIYKKRKCLRTIYDNAFLQKQDNKHYSAFQANFVGKTLDCDKCPHRGFDLNQIPEIAGFKTCPLHGLVFQENTCVDTSILIS